MAGKGGGAWKVAYADFVTAMMAFFMVMWLISSGDKKLKEAIAQHFRDPFRVYQAGTSNIPPHLESHPPERIVPDLEPLVSDAKKDPEKHTRNTNMAKRYRGDRTAVGGMVTFDGDETGLNQLARETLDRMVPHLAGKSLKIEICGHAARKPANKTGVERDAWSLSYQRCRVVMKYLEERGIPPERMRMSQGGSYEPYSIGYDPERLAYNSRVEVFMLPETVQNFQGSETERKARLGEVSAEDMAGDEEGADGASTEEAANPHSSHAADAHAEPAAHEPAAKPAAKAAPAATDKKAPAPAAKGH